MSVARGGSLLSLAAAMTAAGLPPKPQQLRCLRVLSSEHDAPPHHFWRREGRAEAARAWIPRLGETEAANVLAQFCQEYFLSFFFFFLLCFGGIAYTRSDDDLLITGREPSPQAKEIWLPPFFSGIFRASLWHQRGGNMAPSYRPYYAAAVESTYGGGDSEEEAGAAGAVQLVRQPGGDTRPSARRQPKPATTAQS
jgi:hypothetical protein